MSWTRWLSKKIIGPTCDAKAENTMFVFMAYRAAAAVDIVDSVTSFSSPCHFVILFDVDDTMYRNPSKIIWVESAQKAEQIASQSLPMLSARRSYSLSYQESFFRLFELLLDASASWEEGSRCRKEAFDCAEKLGDYLFDTVADLSAKGLVNCSLYGGTFAMNDTERKLWLELCLYNHLNEERKRRQNGGGPMSTTPSAQ